MGGATNPGRGGASGRVGRGVRSVLLAALVLTGGGWSAAAPVRGQDATPTGEETGDAAVRVVHGSADAGPVDLYVDGEAALTGLEFPSASAFLFLAAGEHRFQVVPTGADPGQAVIDATQTLDAGLAYEVAALGPVAEVQAGVYEVDLRPLADGRARLRVVHGSPDLGPIDVAVTGGDLLFPTLGYPNESNYLDLDAGTYDLEVRSAGTDEVAIPLAGANLDAGTVYDLFAVGLLADGTLQSLLVTATPETAQVGGRPAHIHTGACADLGPIVVPLTNVTVAEGDRLGQEDAAATESSATNVPLGLDAIVAEAHAIDVHRSEEEIGTGVACGEIGGTLTESGNLVVGLREQNGSGLTGIAFLSPSVTDPATTDVSVFLAQDLAATGVIAVVTPVADDEAIDAVETDQAPEATPVG